jgi:hypothetical protein
LREKDKLDRPQHVSAKALRMQLGRETGQQLEFFNCCNEKKIERMA